MNPSQCVPRLQKPVPDMGIALHWPGGLEAAAMEEMQLTFISSWLLASGASLELWEEESRMPKSGTARARIPTLHGPSSPESQFPHLSNGDDPSKSAFADIYGILTVPNASRPEL